MKKDSEVSAISAEAEGADSSLRIARNAGVVLIARGINIVVRVLTISLFATYLGKEGFGVYSYIVALGEIFAVLSDFGVIRVGVREIARDKESAAEQFGNVLALKGLLSLATIAILAIMAWATRMEPSLRAGVTIYTLAVILNYYANSFFVFYRAFERMEYESFLIILERGLYLLLSYIAVRWNAGLYGIFVANLISSAIKLVTASVVTHLALVKLSLQIRARSFVHYFRESLPIGIAMFLASIYLRVDVLILEYLRTSAEVGAFSGAYRIVDATMVFPVVIVTALFPVLSRRAKASPEILHGFIRKSLRVLLLIALPIAVGIFVWAEPLVNWILDASFVESIHSLRLLALILVLSYPNFLFNYVMTALGKQARYTAVIALSLGLNVLVAFLLIPSLGYVGACLATVSAELFSFGLALYLLRHYTGYSPVLSELGKLLVAASIMGGIAYAGNSLSPVVRIVVVSPLAGIAYVVGLVALGVVSTEEILTLRTTLSGVLKLGLR